MEEELANIEIAFSDQTIIESECKYDKVRELVENGRDLEEWVVESEFGLVSDEEDAEGFLKFWKNCECVLAGYSTSFEKNIMPVDLVFLHEYLKEGGWELVIDEMLVASNPEFFDRYFAVVYGVELESVDQTDFNLENEEELNFWEYTKKLKEKRSRRSNRYSMENLKEFENHGYDMKKRKENEERSLF